MWTNSFPMSDSFWSKSKGWEGWMCSSTLFKMKTSFWKGRAGCHLLEEFSVSFTLKFWIHSEPLMALPQVTTSSMASKGIDDLLYVLACGNVEGKYLCLLYSHEIFNWVTCFVISYLKLYRNRAFESAETPWDELVKGVKGNCTGSSH